MFAEILVDVIIAAIIIIGAALGISRGFIITVTKPVKWVAAIVLAVALCNPVADALVQPLIEAPITNQISDYLSDKCANITAATAGEQLPTVLKLAAGIVDVDVSSLSGGSSEEFIIELVDKLAIPAIHLISVIISFAVVYILSKILLALLVSIINKIFDYGVFGVFNKILGFVFGTAFAFITVWILTSIFGCIICLPSVSDIGWISDFEGGYIYKFFKEISPMDILLSF